MAFCSDIATAVLIAAMFKMFATEPRFVSCAPLGKPVVPEV